MKEITGCEVCGNKALRSVLDLGSHPLCDDLVPIGSDRICKEYPIEVLLCDTCLTAHQRFQVPKEELFPTGYHYRAQVTGSVLSGMSGFVDSCEERFGSLKDKVVLDIGCNDGSMLNFFKAKGCKTFGVEPTGAALECKHKTLNCFFERNAVDQIAEIAGKPDFITFTNVFAHIDNLSELLANLKLLMKDETVIVIENHYMGDILRRGQFDTFYHEHPRTYSLRSFEYIAKNLGVQVLDAEFVSRYGGNIRVYLGLNGRSKVAVDESQFGRKFDELAAEVSVWKEEAGKIIEDLVRQHGKLRAKAFPGRAAILMKLLGLTEKEISAVYEIKGSIKVGHYVPGTRIPILPEVELFAQDMSRPILNLAWHIPAEVRANLAAHHYIGKVIDIK